MTTGDLTRQLWKVKVRLGRTWLDFTEPNLTYFQSNNLGSRSCWTEIKLSSVKQSPAKSDFHDFHFSQLARRWRVKSPVVTYSHILLLRVIDRVFELISVIPP